LILGLKMSLVKFVFAFIAVGGATYAIFKFDKDAPRWLKNVSYIMALAALITAIPALPQAFQVVQQGLQVSVEGSQKIGEWFSKIDGPWSEADVEVTALRKAMRELPKPIAVFFNEKLGVDLMPTPNGILEVSSTLGLVEKLSVGDKLLAVDGHLIPLAYDVSVAIDEAKWMRKRSMRFNFLPSRTNAPKAFWHTVNVDLP
jgi:hypothetical protein